MKPTGVFPFWLALFLSYCGSTVATDRNDAIKVYDELGHEFLIPRETYRADVLPGELGKSWNDEHSLYAAIVSTLREEFYLEALKPALRYQEISTDPESAAVLLGITYLKLNRLSEARMILQGYLDTHGDSGVILTNLAKVVADEGKAAESQQILWKSLTVDPNQANAIDWWGAIHYESGGASARIKAIERVAAIPGSWRPQLWLARDYLETGDKSKALTIYRSTLAIDEASVGDVLMMIAGDLGKHGAASDAIALVAPNYDPKTHGIETGVNLVLAYKQLGMKRQGLDMLNKLEELRRYDWKQYLDKLKSELQAM